MRSRPDDLWKPNTAFQFLQFHFKTETATQTRRTDHFQGPVHHLAELGTNGQAQSGTARGMLLVIGLIERFEQIDLLLARNTHARIDDLPLQPYAPFFAPKHVQVKRYPASLGELDGVAQ